MIYDCVWLYVTKFLIDSIRICYGDGNSTDYYEIDDVHLMVSQGGDSVTKNQ